MPTNNASLVCSTSDTRTKELGEGAVLLMNQTAADDGDSARPSARIATKKAVTQTTCTGPGRNGDELCGKPTQSKTFRLCRSHNEQLKKHGTLLPLRTRTTKSTCIGPGQHGGVCGREVYSRPVGQDDGICKTHYDQVGRKGCMAPIEQRLAPIPTTQCWGPGQDGNERCDRIAEGRETLLCSPHDRQHKKNAGVLKPIRRINTPDGPCQGPADEGSLCGRPIENKTHRLCGGHYAQHNRGVVLSPLKVARKRGEVVRCAFPGCRYPDAPDAEGLCRHHWRQKRNGQDLVALKGNPNRGKAVLIRDEAGNKFCYVCGQWKPEAGFNNSSNSSDGLDHRCRRCHASAQKKARYGIDLDHYEVLLASQGGKCAICPAELAEGGNRLSIDHDHACCPGTLSCGKCVRGILCPSCNMGLGRFQDDVDLLKRAASYLILNAVVVLPHDDLASPAPAA